MATQYSCGSPGRRRAVLDARNQHGQPPRNGIDYLEVADDQRTLTVFFLHPLPGPPDGVPGAPELTAANILIEGGVRVTGIKAVEPVVSAGRKLTVRVSDSADISTFHGGDFSTYRLRLVEAPDHLVTPAGFDTQLAAVEFSFKVACPSEFDCRAEQICLPDRLPEPSIDYLAKDYASFRRLMLDRLAVTIPDWPERNPADQAVAVVETLAYVADQISYHQDAAATEAYLGTARRRVSLRRHARLLDYRLNEGCNARTWVFLEVATAADGKRLDGPDSDKDKDRPGAGALLVTQTSLPRGEISLMELDQLRDEAPAFFETMHNITLWEAHNEINFYTWGDEQCCLPKGATRATLRNTGKQLHLQKGDCVLFEEVRGPKTGQPADADPSHRHIVRLTECTSGEDPLFADDLEHKDSPVGPRLQVLEIAWDPADALPFPLCLDQVEDDATPGKKQPVSVARGNIVLADHGLTIQNEMLDPVDGQHRYRPRLAEGPLTWQGYLWQSYLRNRRRRLVLFDKNAPASTALHPEPRQSAPAIRLREMNGAGSVWLPQRDLLNSGRFAREFVAEVEDDSRASLRFGDGSYGQCPQSQLRATYRVGNGIAGNVGAEAIAHVVGFWGISKVRNPLPAQGGQDPETATQVRLYAPQAFRTPQRAVTEADYAMVAERHPEVARAVATRRWTGSWYTMFLTIDRRLGREIDSDFEDELRRHMDQYRLMGHDLEIDRPLFVPLEIILTVCVKPGYIRGAVKKALLDIFSNRDLPDGRRGFFHPDNFTFGQPVYLSRVVATAMQAAGVQWIDTDDTPPKPNRFRRWGKASHGEIAAGEITIHRLEIARLDNDPNAPENGKIDFVMQGGR